MSALEARVDPTLRDPTESDSGAQRVIIAIREEHPETRREGVVFGARRARSTQRFDARRLELAVRKQRVIEALRRVGDEGFSIIHDYSNFALMALFVDSAHLSALSEHNDVETIWADTRGEAHLDSSVPFIEAPRLHADGDLGAGSVVAVLDSPIRYWATDGSGDGYFGTCPERGEFVADTAGCAVVDWVDATSPSVEPYTVASNSSHGTQMGAMVLGVAPSAELLSVNVFRWGGGFIYYRMSDVIAGLDWVAENADEHNIVAVNMSLGGNWPGPMPCDSLEVIPASWPASTTGSFPTAYFDPIRTLWAEHGIISVSSTGNDGRTGQIKSPACVSLALSVAALFDTDLATLHCGGFTQSGAHPGEVACFSNINRAVDIVAPGVWIDSAGHSGTYGTSNAVPHVAGALALLQSRWSRIGGSTLDPVWAHRRLLLQALPFEHNDVAQRALHLGGDGSTYDEAFDFPGYYRAEPEGVIPALPAAHEETIEVTGSGATVDELLLYLEVVHPSPEELELELTAPSGVSASIHLPAGGYGFNAILGRDVLPDAFETLSGASIDGTWTLSLGDDGSAGDRGYYLSATAFVFTEDCVPDCSGSTVDRVCGDDRCGGTCGTCSDGSACTYSGQCLACDASCGARSCGDDRCGSTCGGCDDDLFCNGWEYCVNGTCAEGLSPCQMNDELTCTVDCDETADVCNGPTPDMCVIDEACVEPGTINPANPCEECDPSSRGADWSADDTNACSDSDVCTEGDHCASGICVGGSDVDCDDGNPCTDESCSAETGCQYSDNTEDCDNGDVCTENDQCGGGECLAGEPTVCDDENECTDDTCDSAVGCVFANNSAECDDGDACTTGDVCSRGECGGEPLSCDDDDACTIDICDSEIGCVPTLLSCLDENLCTEDSCDPERGCVFTPIECDDNDACTESTCDSAIGCIFTDITCDDFNACTTDACDSSLGCIFAPHSGPCDDGDACTSGDICSDGECQAGDMICSSEEGGCSCRAASTGEMGGQSILFFISLLAIGGLRKLRSRQSRSQSGRP